jgi:hypothetical protein
MPDCDLCGTFVKRRKTLKEQMKHYEYLDLYFNDEKLIRNEIKVCDTCYSVACKKNPNSETCKTLKNYLKESNEIEDDFIRMKSSDKCKKCNILSNRRSKLQASNNYDDVLDEIYTCGRCYDDNCFNKAIEKATVCKNIDKNKKLATFQRERLDEKRKSEKLIAATTLARAYPDKFKLDEFLPSVPKTKLK